MAKTLESLGFSLEQLYLAIRSISTATNSTACCAQPEEVHLLIQGQTCFQPPLPRNDTTLTATSCCDAPWRACSGGYFRVPNT